MHVIMRDELDDPWSEMSQEIHMLGYVKIHPAAPSPHHAGAQHTSEGR